MTKLTASQKAMTAERNSNFYINSDTIQKAFVNLQALLQRIPSIKELSEETGLAVSTVSEHLKSLRVPDFAESHILRTNGVINKLYSLAEAGDVQASNTLFKYVIPSDGLNTGDNNGSTNIQVNFIVKDNTNVD